MIRSGSAASSTPVGQRDVARGDLRAGLEALDRDLEVVGQVRGVGAHRKPVVLGHDQRVAGRPRRSACTGMSTVIFSPRRTMSRSTCSNVSLIGSRWIALGSASACGAVADLDGEQLVHAAVADRGGELARGQRDVPGLLAVAVQHGGHQAGPAGTAGTTLAELGAGLGADLYLGHGETPGLRYTWLRVRSAVPGEGRAGHGARSTASITVPPGGRPCSSGRGAPSPWQPQYSTRSISQPKTRGPGDQEPHVRASVGPSVETRHRHTRVRRTRSSGRTIEHG